MRTRGAVLIAVFLSYVRPAGAQGPDAAGKKPETTVKKTETTMKKTEAPGVGGRRGAGNARPRPLYDVPYMFDAREFLRKKLIGQKVKNCFHCRQAKKCSV